MAKNTTSKPRPMLKLVRRSIALLIAVSGILFILHPRYSIDVDERFNPHNPFKNPIIITNNGYFSLNFLYSISPSNFKDIFGNSYGTIVVGGFEIESLNADRKAPIDLMRAFHVDINNFVTSSLDLSIDIEARTVLFGFIKYPDIKKEVIRFKLKRSHDGKYIWQQNG